MVLKPSSAKEAQKGCRERELPEYLLDIDTAVRDRTGCPREITIKAHQTESTCEADGGRDCKGRWILIVVYMQP